MSSTDNEDNSMACNFCDKTFGNKTELMAHKKAEHTKKVKHCWHFAAGTCPFREQKCWFIHSKNNSNLSDYTCKYCEEAFTNQSDLLHHRKRKHEEHVQPCNNIRNGKCTFGNEKCWFNHEGQKSTKENENENYNVVQRIFIMMEKMTERIVRMEMNNENVK